MKKWIVMLAVLVMFCLAGCGEKPMTAVYFHTDDNSWYFADLDTDTIFSGTIPDKLTDENGKKYRRNGYIFSFNIFLKKLYFITLQSPDASWKAAPSGNDRPFPDCPVLSVPSL